ncbi:MAG: aminotransferase class I/II-fold pyridoxal phosphate-dependent enzyme [Bacteroidales bacterium]|nr:aminotransferase class I/II-fold pyridoxal phosphate-dependent enzyme [Bacteroidales bacterium]
MERRSFIKGMAAARIGMIFAGPTKAFILAGLSGTAYRIIPDETKREKYLGCLRNAKLNEASIMTIEATIAAYRKDTTWLESLKRYIEGNIFRVEKFVATHDIGIKSIRPQASFLMWMDCRELGLPQETLMERFIKDAKVIPSDGSSYGPGGEGFVRLNVGCPVSVLDKALERMAEAFRR